MSTSPRIAARRATSLTRFLTAAAVFIALFFAASSARPALAQQSVGSPNLVVSQLYTRGGENGAAHPTDFIEIFNRGSNTIDLTQYSIQLTTTNGNTTSSVMLTFVSSQGGIPMQPGQYRTIEFPVIVTPPGIPSPPTLGPTGKIAIVRNKEAIPAVQCPLGQDPDIEDYVGYGGANCFEGNGPAPVPTLTLSASRANNGCTDTDNNVADFSLAGAPSPRDSFTGGTPLSPCALPPGTSTFQFSAGSIATSEGVSTVEVGVTRTGGDISTPATVDYATTDGTAGGSPASERKDYTTALGTLRFAAGETSKGFTVLLNDDVIPEDGSEYFDISLSNPTGATALADPSTLRVTLGDDDTTQQPNPIDLSTFFVNQHYHDFLNRVPDQSGFDFWVNNIDVCRTNDGCREVKRIDTSAAFFLAIEFQETGVLVYRLFRAAYTESPARPRGLPRYREFIRDTQAASRGVIVGQNGWEQVLEANTQALVNEFVARAEFKAKYDALTNAQYVDALNANTNGSLSPSERDALVAGLSGGTLTRADVLRSVAEDADFARAELNRAFVLMQYFGYLRRSPDDAPDSNFNGYDFWLTKLNQFNGDYRTAEMVKAFITSPEYRARFALQ